MKADDHVEGVGYGHLRQPGGNGFDPGFAGNAQQGDVGILGDWRFGIAYNTALKLCTILLYASGYRAERTLQHYRTIQAMPLILGKG